MRHRLWKPYSSSNDKKAINALRRHYKFTDITARILVDRGIDTIKKAERFFNIQYADLHDPFLLEDMSKAVQRILQAKHENILIFGDYDVDGLTSNAMLTKALRLKGFKNIRSEAGSRKFGYGIKLEHIEKAHDDKVNLIITVDLGSTCFKEVDKAKEYGIDVVILDHHLLKETMPDAYALVNPQRGNYPFKGLCAAGVVFKFLQALEKIDGNVLPEQYLEFVALATIADVVPLIDENRYFARVGLVELSKPKAKGLQGFLRANSFYGRKITSDVVAYILGPRINAAGRIKDPSEVLEMFLSEDIEKAREIAKGLTNLNTQRKKIEHQIRDEALKMIEERKMQDDKVIVLASEKWNKGVVGVVATVIMDMFHRPCGLIAIEGNKGTGSFRNIKEFPLIKSLEKCKDLLSGFGGHAMAAGFSIEPNKIDEFRKKINGVASRVLKKEELVPTSYYDARVDFKDLDERLNKELELLQPFGQGNRFPTFLIEDVLIPRAVPTKDGEHLRLTIMKDKTMISGVMFWGAGYKQIINNSAQKFDMLVEFSRNVYDGKDFLQVSLLDLKEVQIKW